MKTPKKQRKYYKKWYAKTKDSEEFKQKNKERVKQWRAKQRELKKQNKTL